MASEWQTVWIQIKTDLWSTVCKGYQQATQAGTVLMDFLCSCQMFYPTTMKQNEYNCSCLDQKQSDKHGRIQRGGGGQGGPDPPPPPPAWKITKIKFFRNTGPDPQENQIATKPAFIVGLSLAWWTYDGPI